MTRVISSAPLPAAKTPTVPATLSRLDLALVFAGLLWGTNYVVSKAVTDTVPPSVYNALRFSAATIAMYVLIRVRHIDLALPRKEWLPVLIASLVSYALYQPLFINGLHNTTVANSVLILTAGPVWVVLFNLWRNQERVTRACILGMMIALVGVAVVIVGRYAGQIALSGSTLSGDTMTLVASVVWAGALLTSRGPLRRNGNIAVTFWLLFGGLITQWVIGIPALATMDWHLITPPTILAMLYSGVISVVVGSIIFNYGIAKLGAARASVYSYLQPLTAATLAVLLLHETFTPWLIVGGAFVFVGVAMVRRT